ncbi:MAG: two-component system sensor histidine kinase PhoQ [Halioglobus sp.]
MTFSPTQSLKGRLFLASLILLPLFLGGTGLYLQRSYQLSLESAESERLQLQVLTLLAEAEFEQSLRMPAQLLESRFNQPNSGLYAVVTNPGGEVLWSSASAITEDLKKILSDPATLATGEKAFSRSDEMYQYSWSVVWETDTGEEAALIFSVLETTRPTLAQLDSLRQSLLLWLGGATLSLLVLQMLVLLWGLRPLGELATDIARIESGQTDKLGGPYPSEIQLLTDNLGSLLQVEKQRRERTRNTLSDLAHSLKTPLAVIRSADEQSTDYGTLVSEQVQQMEQIVSYQLQRSTGGTHNLLRLIPVHSLAERLRSSLLKVYHDKALQLEMNIPADCQFRGDERDLLELLGNLLDNACKYGTSKVRVIASGSASQLSLSVEDDGAGIPLNLRTAILERGARADTSKLGQGIGLAVAADIADSYGGQLQITDSELGGAKVIVNFHV